MARNQVDDIDRGFKKFARSMNTADGSYTKVGVQQGTTHESDGDISDMVLIAAFNEFGTDKIPSRPALRNSLDSNKEKIFAFSEKLLAGVMSGRLTTRQALSALGEFQQSNMQKSITKLRDPANAPKTVKKKGSSNPLVDTGFYRTRAIQHVEVIK